MLVIRTSRVGVRFVIKSLARLFAGLTLVLCLVGISALQAQTLQAQKNTFFIENKGQWGGNALGTPRFLAKTPGASVWVMDDSFVYDFRRKEREKGFSSDASLPKYEREEAERKHTRTVGHVVKMRFADTDASGKPVSSPSVFPVSAGANKQSGYHNYFFGPDSTQWRSNIPLWGEVQMKNIANGADARIYFDGGSVRYDVIVAPGYDPKRLALEFEGLETGKIRVNNSGELVMQTSIGEVTQGKLFAYQEDKSGKKTPVPCRFEIRQGGKVSFALGLYDRSRPLVIDPVLYSTYIGGAGVDVSEHLTIDASGNVYVTGNTSGSFPTTAGAYQTTFGTGANDAFVTKLNPTGTALVYSTYIGGTGDDRGRNIAVDGSGSVVVAGYTSGGFPTTAGVYQTVYGGNTFDAFVTRLNAAGTALVYSTYLGGAGADQGFGIALDAGGNAYAIGQASAGFPTTVGAYQTVVGGATDAFVTKLSPTGTAVYSTFLGGTGSENSFAIAVDASGNAYVTGNAVAGFPTTGGAYQTVFGTGARDAFVTKLNAAGSALVYSTYLGGAGDERGYGIAVDASGNAHIAGYTTGSFPTTGGVFQTTFGGGARDGYVTKLDAAGSALLYSTYLGGAGSDECQGLVLDASGNVVVAGLAGTGFPTTADQTAFGGGTSDAFVSRLNATGSFLDYSSYVGGTGNDIGYGVARDASNNVYIAGETSGSFPTTAGVYQTTFGGGASDVFVAKLGTPLPMNVAGNLPPFTPRPATTPQMNTVNAALATNIVLPFSQNLNAGTVNAPNFRIHSSFMGLKTATYGVAAATATLNPGANFRYGEQVWVSVTNAQSSSGVNTRPFVMSFKALAGAGPATLYPVNSYAIPHFLWGGAMGDFNKDGNMDYVFGSDAGAPNNLLYYYRGNGTGNFTFRSSTQYTTGGGRDIVVGDFNNDTWPDVAQCTRTANTIDIFLNNGAGDFLAPTAIPAPAGSYGICAADFNADGNLDLASVDYNTTLQIILGNGAGGFGTPTFVAGGVVSPAANVRAADFDGDGDIDLAVISQVAAANNLRIFDNNGLGTFTVSQSLTVTAANSLDIGDIDGDVNNTPDIVTINATTMQVYRNTGGLFSLAQTLALPISLSGNAEINLGDMDGDGDLDAVMERGTICRNDGTGNFAYFSSSNYAALGNIAQALGDIDNDGDLDMIFTNYGGSMEVLRNGTQPFITTFAPARNVNNAALAANIAPTFNQTMNAAAASAAVMKVWGGFTGLKTTGAYSGGGTVTPTFNPGSNFRRGEQVWVTVTNAQTSLAGSVGIAARPMVYGFRAAAGVGPATFPVQSSGSPFAVGTNPSDIAAGDFDGDGDIDLAVSNAGTNNVSILLNTGTGSYAAAVNYAAGTQPYGITAGDFDNDGDLDLAVANRTTNNVSILLNNGAGVYAAAVNYAVGTFPNVIVAGDFDGDGDLDLAVANNTTNNVSILLNIGTGAFAAAVNYAVGTLAIGVTCGDLDGDGDLDLAVSNYSSSNVSILLNSGAGTFAAAVNYAVGTNPNVITSGDFDGDGDLDLATSNATGNNISILLNTGTGAYAAAVNYPTGATTYSVIAGDFDGDGDLDLAGTNSSNNVFIMLNTGAGVFGAAVNYPVGTSPWRVFAADLDGDGDLDLATSNNGSTNVSILLNTPLLTVLGNVPPFTPRPTTTPLLNTMNVGTPAGSPVKVPTNIGITFSQNVTAATFSDVGANNARNVMKVHGTTSRGYRSGTGFSGAGATMTFTTTANFNVGEQVWVTVTNAQSTAGVPTRPFVMGVRTRAGTGPGNFMFGGNIAAGTNPMSITTGDFDGDGDVDLAAANGGSNNASIFLNTGTGAFAAAVNYPVGTNPYGITVGDFDNDGDIDLATANFNTANVSILLNNGNGTFAAAANYGAGTNPSNLAAADFDGDGYLDLVVSNRGSANVSVLRNNGNGTFAGTVNYAAGGQPYGVTPGDFDGDGDIDFIVANNTGISFTVFHNTGSGVFVAGVTYPVTGAIIINSGDFDDDGDLDVAVAGASTLTVMFNSGTGTFVGATTYAMGTGTQGIAVGDFDGDGDLDIGCSNSTSVNISWMLNNGAGVFGAVSSVAGVGAPRHNITADFDGDGDLDIASANQGGNNISVFFNQAPMTVLGNVPPFTPRPMTTPLMNTMNVGTPAGSPMKVPMSIDVTFSQNATAATFTDPTARIVMKVFGTTSRGYRSGTGFSGAGATMTFTTTANFNVGEQVWVSVTNAQSMGGAFTRPFVMGVRTRAGAGPATFVPGLSPSATAPFSAMSGDFDGDGDLDLITISGAGNNVEVLLNNGAGVFAAPVSYAVGTNPASIATGDFDSDGDLDLAVTNNGSANVSILRNNGSGVFAAAVNYPFGTPAGIVAGDFDGDGDIDIATTNVGANTVSISLNNGAGVFAAAITYPIGTSPRLMTCGDFDGDGDIDIATANSGSNNVSILLNSGFGTFAAAVNYAMGLAGPFSVSNGDLDNDGDLDLVIGYSGSAFVSVLLNNGTGVFAAPVNYAPGGTPSFAECVDFDGDGDLDIATANFSTNNVGILLNNGAGVFAAAVNYAAGVNSRHLTTGDLDGDGDMDIAVANAGSSFVSILLNAVPMTVLGNVPPYTPRPTTTPLMNTMNVGTPAGSPMKVPMNIDITFNQSATTATFTNGASPNARDVMKVHGTTSRGYRSGTGFSGAGAAMTFTTTANFNVGEHVWVTVTNAQSTGGAFTRPFVMGVRTRAGTGPAMFVPGPVLPVAPGTTPQTTVSGDFDGDGDLDLAVANFGSGNLSVLLNTGSGAFAAAVVYAVGGGVKGLVAGDFNNDGLLDLAVPNSGGSLRVLINAGAGTFPTSALSTPGSALQALTSADFNADGFMDLAAADNGTNSVRIILNAGTGAGTFLAATNYAVGANPFAITCGDFDGDGDIDLAVPNRDANNVSILMNNGAGVFTTAVNYTVGTRPMSIVSGDFNNDGLLDLAVANNTTNNMSILINSTVTPGTFAAAVNYAAGTTPESVTAQDFDGDGDLDLAVANFGSNNVMVFTNSNITPGTFSASGIYAVGTSPISITGGDFDGDGDLDLAVANLTSNDVSILLNALPMNVLGNVPPFTPRPTTTPLLNTMNVGTPAGSPMKVPMNTVPTGISVTFSQNATAATFTDPTARNVMKVFGTTSQGYRSGTGFSGAGATMNFTTTANFDVGEQVWVTVTNAQSTGGAFTRPFVMGFRTRAGAGPGTFVPGSTPAVGTVPRSVSFGDVDGDGDLDMAVANNSSNNVSVLVNTGGGAYAAAVNYPAGTNPFSVSFGDVDGDGDLDMAVANTGSNNVS
ncbi:MAG: VCBS repeat-containing protein, partial [Ignavibacteria bacterium]|nr:VCBS repeat-containing protein [Ignavibacteria bacterium]